MKLSCSTWSFHRQIDSGKYTFDSWIDFCAKQLKLDGLELLAGLFPSADAEYLRKLKYKMTLMNVSVASVSAGNHFTCSKEELGAEIAGVNKWTDVAYYLGSPVVRIFAGSADELTDKEMWDQVAGALRKCCEYGESKGIVMGLENHGGFTGEQVLKLLKDVNHPYLKLTVDTGNFPMDNIYDSIDMTLPHAVLVHLKTYSFDENGMDKTLDYNRIFEIFRKHNYIGFLSLEYEGESDKEDEMVGKSINMMRKLNLESQQKLLK